MSESLPPLDPELASLFAEERARPEPAADTAQARVLARLQASLPLAPTLAAKLGPIVAALVVGGAIGAGVTAKLHEPKVVYVDRPVPSVVATALPAESIALPLATREAPAEPVLAAPSASAAPVDTLARERALLDTARAALPKDPAAALAATERHAREFPRGQMAEEREVLAIQSLARLGRKEESAKRASEFKSRYPNSVLIGVVDSVTDLPGGSK